MGTIKNNRLEGRDLITIGIFTAIIFVLSLIANILGGIHPLTWLLSPAVAAIFTAIPFMLLATKVQKPFAILITGVIMGLIFLVMGMFPVTLPLSMFIGAAFAEIIRFATRYRCFWGNAFAFMMFSIGMAGSPLPLWLFQEDFIAQISSFGLPADYIAAVISYTSLEMLLLMYLLTFICAIAACIITRPIFRKHFERAGII